MSGDWGMKSGECRVKTEECVFLQKWPRAPSSANLIVRSEQLF